MNRIAMKMAFGSFALLLTSSALAAGDFTDSCRKIDLRRGAILDALCQPVSGRASRTGIDLNEYIANDNGDLRWQRNGNFIASSRNCELDRFRGDTILRCEAQRRDGSWTSSSVNLDDRIANINGKLRYQGRR